MNSRQSAYSVLDNHVRRKENDLEALKILRRMLKQEYDENRINDEDESKLWGWLVNLK